MWWVHLGLPWQDSHLWSLVLCADGATWCGGAALGLVVTKGAALVTVSVGAEGVGLCHTTDFVVEVEGSGIEVINVDCFRAKEYHGKVCLHNTFGRGEKPFGHLAHRQVGVGLLDS